MIYPERIEEKIGFGGVRAEIADHCHCEGSRTLCKDMAFLSDFNAINTALSAVNEMSVANHSDEAIPLEGVNDIDRNLSIIKIPGTFLEVKELIRVRRMLDCFGAVAAFFNRHKVDGRTPYPTLSNIAEGLAIIPTSLGMMIDQAVDTTNGLIKDNASPTLADIRSRLRGMSSRVNSILRRVLSSAISQGWLEPDTTPAVRDGRLVLPVPPMNKRKIQGIVLDESASGKTLFIEPAEVVEANNLTRELQLEEHREIIRILTSIADNLRPYIQEMLNGASIIYHLDFINAKALYADAVGGVMPNFHDKEEIEWYHACHPVLKLSLERHNREIVPIDIRLDASTSRILVISGPNAGGKSVCLKTVGTLQYMLQCGILPPVHDNSHFGVFKDIFVDIGDDQSFEDDLSTYSSHLRSMKFMLQRGRKGSLFLIDEMGSGTEPQIGGALARAILEQMNAKEMWGIVTTHYQILKQFAEDSSGLINGSMLYDRHLMQPMFKLSIGNPGSSFAVEIARKIGLPTDIISAAEDIVGKEYVNLDNYLLDITRDKRYWENKRIAIRQKEKKLEQMLAQYSEDAEQLRAKRRDIIEEARMEARKIIDSSNAVIERTIADIKEANAERERTLEARRRLKDERLTIEKDAKNHRDSNAILSKAPKKRKGSSIQQVASGQSKRELTIGANVKLDGGGTVGIILELSGKNAIVAFGNLKTTVKAERLTITDAKPKPTSKSTISMQTIDSGYERQLNFKQEIDLRGMRADEAVQAVTYFIDDAIRFSISRVRILHGTGSGALRQAIRSLLSTTPGIESFQDEDVRFGGAGITVVNLK